MIYLVVLTIFTILMSLLDLKTNKYYKKALINKDSKRLSLVILLLLHNLVFFTQYFTLFFILYWGYKKVNKKILLGYLFYLLGTMFHWITNSRQCTLTEMTNDLLEIDRERRMGMRDPYAIIFDIYYDNAGTGTLRDNLYWTYILTTCGLMGSFLYSRCK